MTYTEQRQKVVQLQKQIQRFTHQMENPKIKTSELLDLGDKKSSVFSEWFEQITIMRAMPEYTGAFKPN